MSVVIAGMKMPKNCYECSISHPKGLDEPWNYACFATMKDVTCDDDSRNRDCPLKSIDGLIKKIVNSPSDVGQDMYKTKYDGAARRQNEIIEIIKEYCEVSE